VTTAIHHLSLGIDVSPMGEGYRMICGTERDERAALRGPRLTENEATITLPIVRIGAHLADYQLEFRIPGLEYPRRVEHGQLQGHIFR